jgi:hypothetical protein
MTYYGLRISKYRACRACTLCLGTQAAGVPAGAAAPVTGAAADEYNLNVTPVVDCNASVTVQVARRSYISVSGSGQSRARGSGGYPGPLAAAFCDFVTFKVQTVTLCV